MKNLIITAIAAFALFVTVAAGSVQAQSSLTTRVTIPFDFSVSGKTFPAGEYVVRRSIEGPRIMLVIRSEDNNEAAYLSTHSITTRDIQKKSKLVFNRYGEEYFLSQVWMSGRSFGDQLTKSREERDLRQLANKTRSPEKVAVVDHKQ